MAPSSLSQQAADSAAEELNKSYYTHLDQRRHMLHKFYVPQSYLAWCGNEINGDSNICKWIQDLPDSEHQVQALQAQSIDEDHFDGKTTVLVTTFGRVVFDYSGSRKAHQFWHTFLLAEVDSKWKIARENYSMDTNLLDANVERLRT